MDKFPTLTKEAINRLQAAPVEVRLWNGCFNIARVKADFARHSFELAVEVTHPLLQWPCGNKSNVTLMLRKANSGHPLDIPEGLLAKISEMKTAATMADIDAAKIDRKFRASVAHTMCELGMQPDEEELPRMRE